MNPWLAPYEWRTSSPLPRTAQECVPTLVTWLGTLLTLPIARQDSPFFLTTRKAQAGVQRASCFPYIPRRNSSWTYPRPLLTKLSFLVPLGLLVILIGPPA